MTELNKGGWTDLDVRNMPNPEQIHEFWRDWLSQELQKDYMHKLTDSIKNSHKELGNLKGIYPPKKDVFKAFTYPRPRVVILGQDPYITENQATGLAFSVPRTEKRPPSLLNVYKELERDGLLKKIPTHGDLSSWCDQGVMLLNTALTVREGKSASHSGFGWTTFTKNALEFLVNSDGPDIVFVLWGGHAAGFASNISSNSKKNLVLTGGHPSPLNQTNPFVGCGHFSKINHFLTKHGQKPIRWDSIKD